METCWDANGIVNQLPAWIADLNIKCATSFEAAVSIIQFCIIIFVSSGLEYFHGLQKQL